MFAGRDLVVGLEKAEADLTRQYVEAYLRLFPDSGATSREIAGGRVSFAGKDSPLSRVEAVGLDAPGLEGAVTPDELSSAEDFLQSRGTRSVIETCAFTDQSVFDFAGSRGYSVGHILNIFAISLNPKVLPKCAAAATGNAIDVHLVSKNLEDSGLWSRTVGLGFASAEDGDIPYLDIYRSIFHADGTTGYIATIDGRPAGAGALKIAGSVAYLSTASTLPSFRRRGVQAALIAGRLAGAIRHGCDLAAIVTSPGSDSEGNVVRSGFAMAYARIRLVKEQ